jgi:subtilisin family serine protease
MKTRLAVLAGCLALLVGAPTPAAADDVLEEGPLAPPAAHRGSPALDSRLAQLAVIEREKGREAAVRFAHANAVPLDADQRVRVLIHPGRSSVPTAASGIAARVAAFGGDVRGRAGDGVEAQVAIPAVEWLPGPREIGWIEPAPVPILMQTTSQGVALTHASTILAADTSYRPSGEPIRVGILDGGFEGYPKLLGSELPATVTARSFHPAGIGGGGVEHGTACAEIVHDMAPDAQLYLANFGSLAEHGQAVDWLVSQRVDVISYSIGWYNSGPGDGRGAINDDVRRALGAGVKWVGSAGNDAQRHWEGVFTDTEGDDWHNYTASDEGNSFSLQQGDLFIAFLSWDDWFQSSQDYDLYVFDQSGRLMTWSAGDQNGTQRPTEAAGFIAPYTGSYFVAINRYAATRDVKLETFFRVESAQAVRMQYVVPAGSLAIPADTDGAIAVGATYWRDDTGEAFSSQGPTTDGRMKPDLSAPDGVDTATYLADGEGFFGTSASAPHVAGAIALLKARFGIYSIDQVVDILYGRAIDKGPSGRDNQYGRGRLDLVGP